MYLLDTNVLSAMMSSQPAAPVAAWIADRPEEELFTASVCQAEILAGIAILPEGRRRQLLHTAALGIFEADFGGRVLPFDQDAARHYAELYAIRRQAGRSVAMADLMIAAIARANGTQLVTRNTRDFEGCGVPLIDPWEQATV